MQTEGCLKWYFGTFFKTILQVLKIKCIYQTLRYICLFLPLIIKYFKMFGNIGDKQWWFLVNTSIFISTIKSSVEPVDLGYILWFSELRIDNRWGNSDDEYSYFPTNLQIPHSDDVYLMPARLFIRWSGYHILYRL